MAKYAIHTAIERLPQPASRWGRRFGLGALTGVAVGLAVALFEWSIKHGSAALIGQYTVFGTAETLHFEIAFLLLPMLGGLMAGLAAYRIYPGQLGHGVDRMIWSFHRNMGELPLGGPVTKAAGCAMVISTGGSVGPEGPIAALGAAIGSFIGRLFPINAHERRILLVAGCAAGIGAIFRSPLGGALFATSVLYSEPEFESDSIVTSFVASVIGYSTFMAVLGYEGPFLEGVNILQFTDPAHLLWYAVLGPLCGVVAIFFYFCMHWTEKFVAPSLPMPLWAKPMIGGLITGLIGCLLPQVMDGRFSFIQHAVDGSLFTVAEHTQHHFSPYGWVALFGMIVIAKCVATGAMIGSGAPGGVLGPAVFIGGAVGAFLGAFGQALLPDSFPPELRQALIPVGTAGVLAATMRTPLAAIVMTTEMTGSFGLIPPLMLVCVSSYIVGRKFGLNHEQVRTASDSPTHAADPIIHLLESWKVCDLMERDWPMVVHPDATVDEIIRKFKPGDRPVVAVVDDENNLLGVISPADIGVVMEENPVASLLIAEEIMTTKLICLYANDDICSALTLFNRTRHDTMPVLADRRGDRQWVGMLTRKHIVERLHHEIEESHRIAFAEYPSLDAIKDVVQIDQLVMGVPSARADIHQLFVPMDVVGKSLRESDFRNKYDAQVVAVQQRDGSVNCPPDLDSPLRTDQRLLVVMAGKREAENKMDAEIDSDD